MRRLHSAITSDLAATLLAVMFGLWVFIVHIPRAIAAAGEPNE
ncbi:MAG: hypothetical protein ABJB66_05760 [Gemmatimonadaceae bacterium]